MRFELTRRFPAGRLSKPLPSTTRAPAPQQFHTGFTFESSRFYETVGLDPSINANRLPDGAGTQPRDFDLQRDLQPKRRERREP